MQRERAVISQSRNTRKRQRKTTEKRKRVGTAEVRRGRDYHRHKPISVARLCMHIECVRNVYAFACIRAGAKYERKRLMYASKT